MNNPATKPVDIKSTFPNTGCVQWIGLRPGPKADMTVVSHAEITVGDGLVGDRFSGSPGAPRQVTLIQLEHLHAAAELLRVDSVDPALVRRNIVVSGINLTALKGAKFSIGDVVLLGTGPCAPCSRMEYNLGAGGYNAMRGHGGITASVVQGGKIQLHDEVRFVELADKTNPSSHSA